MVRKLTIAYRGTSYSGWQRQPNAVTVQQVVEEALSRLAEEEISVVGASRTDAGVHARGQVAHLEGMERLPELALVHGGNHLLPEDIRIVRAERADDDFHARKHAVSKLYCYRLIAGDVLSPLDALFASRVAAGIDAGAMARACEVLVGEHDFGAFALAGGSHRSARRRIFSARCEQKGERIRFLVRGDGFLRGMVRSLVGTLIEVGVGKRAVETIGELLEGAPRSAAGPTAPAAGLTLEGVEYVATGTDGDAGDRHVVW